MTPDADPRARLFRVGYDFGGAGTWVADAVRVAEDLVAAGYAGPATVEVACLPRGSVRSDAEPAIARMLAEHGVPFAAREEDRLGVALAAFANGGVTAGEIFGEVFDALPSVAEQTERERAFVALLDAWEGTADVRERERLVPALREAAAAVLGDTTNP